MTVKTTLKDGTGTNREASVDKNHALLVTNTGVPPSDIGTALKPFAAYMLDSSGSEDMQVSASLTSYVDFAIGSSSEGDRHIHTLAFTISDAGATLKEFGSITALTNGCQLIYQDNILGDVVIADNLQANFDFVQLCNFEPSFGTGTAAFRASNVSGSSEAFVPVLDVNDVFGLPYGLRIPKNSNKKLILRVRDTTTAVDRFDVKVFGFDRIESDA